MLCPHCRTNFYASWSNSWLEVNGGVKLKSGPFTGRAAVFRSDATICPNCSGATINVVALANYSIGATVYGTMRVLPRGGSMPPPPVEVPGPISADYAEANEVLLISPKASAALSRRCLQSVLSAHGYSGRDLVKQINQVLAETNSSRSLPVSIRDNIDAIRNFGNFSAHPITDSTTLQVLEVEEGEAEWCLQILQDLFEHYYVAPARAAERRANLAEKLAAAGKPPMLQGVSNTSGEEA